MRKKMIVTVLLKNLRLKITSGLDAPYVVLLQDVGEPLSTLFDYFEYDISNISLVV